MAVSMDLRVLARKLEKSSDELLISASTKSPEVFQKVATAVAAASTLLEGVADDMDNNASFEITPQQLDEIAALASAFDESDDPLLKKQASVLDELLLSIAAPKNALAISRKATEDEINRLRDERRKTRREEAYEEPRQVLSKMENAKEQAKAVEQQVKRYIPMEAPLQTRYPPDRPGGQMTRITDHVYQDIVTGIIYDYKAGYKTQKGNEIPGGSVEDQTRELGDNRNRGTSLFETRESLMGRYASDEKVIKIASALKAVRDHAPGLLDRAIDAAMVSGLSTSQVADILASDISSQGLKVIADDKKKSYYLKSNIDRHLTPEEDELEYWNMRRVLGPLAEVEKADSLHADVWRNMMIDHINSAVGVGLSNRYVALLIQEFLSPNADTIPPEAPYDTDIDSYLEADAVARQSLIGLVINAVQELAPHLLKATIAKAQKEGIKDYQIKSVLSSGFNTQFNKPSDEIKVAESLLPHLRDLGWNDLIDKHLKVMASLGVSQDDIQKIAGHYISVDRQSLTRLGSILKEAAVPEEAPEAATPIRVLNPFEGEAEEDAKEKAKLQYALWMVENVKNKFLDPKEYVRQKASRTRNNLISFMVEVELEKSLKQSGMNVSKKDFSDLYNMILELAMAQLSGLEPANINNPQIVPAAQPKAQPKSVTKKVEDFEPDSKEYKEAEAEVRKFFVKGSPQYKTLMELWEGEKFEARQNSEPFDINSSNTKKLYTALIVRVLERNLSGKNTPTTEELFEDVFTAPKPKPAEPKSKKEKPKVKAPAVVKVPKPKRAEDFDRDSEEYHTAELETKQFFRGENPKKIIVQMRDEEKNDSLNNFERFKIKKSRVQALYDQMTRKILERNLAGETTPTNEELFEMILAENRKVEHGPWNPKAKEHELAPIKDETPEQFAERTKKLKPPALTKKQLEIGKSVEEEKKELSTKKPAKDSSKIKFLRWGQYQKKNNVVISEAKADELETKILSKIKEDRTQLESEFNNYVIKCESTPESITSLPDAIREEVNNMLGRGEGSRAMVTSLTQLNEKLVEKKKPTFIVPPIADLSKQRYLLLGMVKNQELDEYRKRIISLINQRAVNTVLAENGFSQPMLPVEGTDFTFSQIKKELQEIIGIQLSKVPFVSKAPLGPDGTRLVQFWEDPVGYWSTFTQTYRGWGTEEKRLQDIAMIEAGYNSPDEPVFRRMTSRQLLRGIDKEATGNILPNFTIPGTTETYKTLFSHPMEYKNAAEEAKRLFSTVWRENPEEWNNIVGANKIDIIADIPLEIKRRLMPVAFTSMPKKKYDEIAAKIGVDASVAQRVYDYVKQSGANIRKRIIGMTYNGMSFEQIKEEIEEKFPGAVIPWDVVEFVMNNILSDKEDTEESQKKQNEWMAERGFYPPYQIAVGGLGTGWSNRDKPQYGRERKHREMPPVTFASIVFPKRSMRLTDPGLKNPGESMERLKQREQAVKTQVAPPAAKPPPRQPGVDVESRMKGLQSLIQDSGNKLQQFPDAWERRQTDIRRALNKKEE
jgi:hypothetical protein